MENGFNIVLVEPQIPPNTGNISRLSVGTGSSLHIVGKCGFNMDEKSVRRAGLDHWQHVKLSLHPSLDSCITTYPDARFLYFSKFSKIPYTQAQYEAGDFLVFGSETSGLPRQVIEKNKERCFSIPISRKIRSLNLSNACAIIVYEAIRQTGFRS